MLALGLRTLQLVLAAGCVYLAYLAVAPLVGAAPMPRLELPELAPTQDHDQSFARYQIISERNLFQARDVPIAGAPVGEELEESKLKLRLLGTTAADPHELSVASVEDTQRRENVTLRVGDLVSGAEVIRIERRRIVLDNGGRHEQLTLDDSAQTRPPPRAISRAQSTRRAAPRARPRRPPSPRPAAPEPTLEPSLEAYRTLLGGEGLDLAEGERVTAVDGLSLEDPDSLRKALESLSSAGSVTLTVVDPQGQSREIEWERP